MNRKFSRLIYTVLSAAMLLSGCAENTDAAKGDPEGTEAETTTVEDTETPEETSVLRTTIPSTTMVTTPLSPDGGFMDSYIYRDENGEVLLEVTDGFDYVDYIAYYHGYFKVTNVSDKTVTDLREKIADIEMFADTKSMTIEYPFGDNCMDVIEWNNGKPDFENMSQFFDAMAEQEYTFDNTLDPDEYCIVSVTFNNGTEITTTTEKTETTTTTTTTALETTTSKKTVTTTTSIEEIIPENTTARPLTDPIYNKYMPSDKIIKEAAEIAVRDQTVIIAIYEDGTYKAMTTEEAENLKNIGFLAEIISEESYKDMLEMYEEYPELMDDEFAVFMSDYESFVEFWLESYEVTGGYKEYFDDNGKPLVNTKPFFAVSFSLEGKDGNVKLNKVAETALRWVFAQRTDDKTFNYLIDECYKFGLGDSVVVRCTYKGGDTAHAEFIYYSHSIVFDPEVTLTF